MNLLLILSLCDGLDFHTVIQFCNTVCNVTVTGGQARNDNIVVSVVLRINGYLCKLNLIILSNGENISPEEIEGKLALNDLIAEIIVTGEDNLLTARIYPEKELVENMSEEEINAALQEILNAYNKTQPTYKQLSRLVVRKYPFFKNASRKIIRTEVLRDEPVT